MTIAQMEILSMVAFFREKRGWKAVFSQIFVPENLQNGKNGLNFL